MPSRRDTGTAAIVIAVLVGAVMICGTIVAVAVLQDERDRKIRADERIQEMRQRIADRPPGSRP